MRVLIAEDNSFYRRALELTLREWDYDVVSVADGQSAWDILQGDNAPKLAVLDWMMPGLEGPQICRRLRASYRHEPTYVIILTSKDGTENAVTALESGADDYIMKPFNRDELQARLRVGRRIVGLQTSETIVYSFARAVDAKSPFTHGHSDRVTRYALALGEHIGLSRGELEIIRRGGILHDIGKICVPDAILNKAGPLTTEEFAVVKMHPEQGARMVESLEAVKNLIPIIRWHHERLDGRGYPDGLKGEQIPHLVRVVSVADVYDAVRSDRPYRSAMSHDECLAILRKDAAGGGLDRHLVEKFCEIAFDTPLSPEAVAPVDDLTALPHSDW